MGDHDLSYTFNSFDGFLSLNYIYLHHFLVLVVQSRCCFIQNDHGWVSHQCSGNSYSLLLSAWEIWASSAYFFIKCLYFNRVCIFYFGTHLFFSLGFFFLLFLAELGLVLIFHSEISLHYEVKSFGHFARLYYIFEGCIFTIILYIFINGSVE